jgi:hypothetical protein
MREQNQVLQALIDRRAHTLTSGGILLTNVVSDGSDVLSRTRREPKLH